MCVVPVRVKDNVHVKVRNDLGLFGCCSNQVPVGSHQNVLPCIAAEKEHGTLGIWEGRDTCAIRQYKKKCLSASHNLTTTTKKPLSHVTENYGSPSGAPGVQVSGRKEEKMEERWDWCVLPPWGETTAGMRVDDITTLMWTHFRNFPVPTGKKSDNRLPYNHHCLWSYGSICG